MTKQMSKVYCKNCKYWLGKYKNYCKQFTYSKDFEVMKMNCSYYEKKWWKVWV